MNIQPQNDSSQQQAAPSGTEKVRETGAESKEQNKKSLLCVKYRRGTCKESPSECIYAHGVKDLKWKKLDLQAFNNPDGKEDKKEEEEEAEEKEKIKVNDKDGYPLIYQYQLELQKTKPDLKIYTQDELDKNINCLRDIRWQYRAHIAQEFMDFLFETYGQNYLPRAFVKVCVESIGWEARWVYIMSNNYAVERELSKEGAEKLGTSRHIILKMPQGKHLEEYIDNAIIKIVKENKLLEALPINPSNISAGYFKTIVKDDPLAPNLLFLLKIKNMKKIDEYLKELEKNLEFAARLANECNFPLENLKGITIFDENSPEFMKLLSTIESSLVKTLDASPIGFHLFSDYEKMVMHDQNKLIHQVGKQHHQIKQIIYETAFKKKVILIDLLSDYYFISLPKLMNAKVQTLAEDFNKEMDKSCIDYHITNFEIGENHHFKQPPKKNEVDYKSKMPLEKLKEQIDFNKILLVNSSETLNEAQQIISNTTAMGIDLEGTLGKGGLIELIQCACKEKIVIFDVYQAKCEALEKGSDSAEGVFHNDMMKFIKLFMEDEKITKVFHDCRRDSLALHLFAHACPNNVYDTSALYMLIEDLITYQKYGTIFGFGTKEETKSDESTKVTVTPSLIKEIIQNLEKSGPPGLNDVFVKYKAEHGKNNLKEIMKERFDQMDKDYFYQRPIDLEYLIYSAKDVEDLVDVKDKMITAVTEILKNLNPSAEPERAVALCKKVSKTYASFGCLHSKADK